VPYEYKIGELRGEERDGSFHVARVTARGRKTIVKIDADTEEYSQPEVWFGACEQWLDLVGRQGWRLVHADSIGECHVRYTLVRSQGSGDAQPQEKTLTQQLTEQVTGKAVRSVFKVP
jgi:hypothetical protein